MKTYRVRYTAQGSYYEHEATAPTPVEAAWIVGWANGDLELHELTLHGVDEVAEREHQPDARTFADVLDKEGD